MMRIGFIAAAVLVLAACASTPSAKLPAAPPPGEPGELFGLAPAQIRTAFGAPAFKRNDGNAQMWRYDGRGCKAFVFFNKAGGTPAVSHVETLPRGRTIAADLNCLKTLRAGQPPVS